jgi:WhiB family redox-sensing transcriptional regulator
MAKAQCRFVNPDLFYPSITGRWSEKRIAAALKVCGKCPVTAECLAWAFETKDGHAILGGTTPDQRKTMKRKKEAALTWMNEMTSHGFWGKRFNGRIPDARR